MRALPTYLWKEWRDQRVTVFGILAVQFLASLFLVLFLRDTVVGGAGMVSAITLGSLALTLVAFGPELIAGETRTGTLGLLGRMPSGLHLAFWAKVLFLFGALAALFWSGYLISCGFHLIAREAWEDLGTRFFLDSPVVPGAVTVGLLLMAVSTWLPRSILTIPATALLSLALLLPCFFIWSRNLQLASYLDIGSAIYFGPPLALCVAWLSFTRGRRAGGGPASSAWRGLLACVVVSIPMWSWVGYWMHEWTTPRPRENMEIWGGFMGVDGRLAFLNTNRRPGWPWLSLVADLETGEWRQLGEPNELVAPIGWNEPFSRTETGEHLLLGLLPGQEEWVTFSYLDPATGDVFREANFGAPYADILERARAAMRNVSPIRMPDGRRVWIFRRRLEMDSEGGGFEELPWDSRDMGHRAIGYGLRVYRPRNKFLTYDLTRGRLFHNRTSELECCWVLESRWLVADRGDSPPHVRSSLPYFRDWRLLDPDSGEEEPAPGMHDGDRVVAVLDDGRVLVRDDGNDGEATEMVTVDVSSGIRQVLTMDTTRPWSLSEGLAPIRAPDGRRLFQWFDREERVTYLTSLAPGSNQLTPPVPTFKVMGCPELDTAMIISSDRQRIERVNLLTGEREVVFPRPE